MNHGAGPRRLLHSRAWILPEVPRCFAVVQKLMLARPEKVIKHRRFAAFGRAAATLAGPSWTAESPPGACSGDPSAARLQLMGLAVS